MKQEPGQSSAVFALAIEAQCRLLNVSGKSALLRFLDWFDLVFQQKLEYQCMSKSAQDRDEDGEA